MRLGVILSFFSAAFLPLHGGALVDHPSLTLATPDPRCKLNLTSEYKGCQCPTSEPPAANPPSPVNMWSSLTIAETSEIQAWLEDPKRDLNLHRPPEATLTDNVVFLIETYYPSKADALSHLDSPETVPPPERYARVVVHHGADSEPSIKNYLVGPLPVSERTRIEELSDIYHRDIPYTARVSIDGAEAFDGWKYLPRDVLDALEDLFNASITGDPKRDTLTTEGNSPVTFDGSFRRIWFSWYKNSPALYLLPLNFYHYVDVSSLNQSEWKTLKVVYGRDVFNSTDAFLDAYRSGQLQPADTTMISALFVDH
ncbi:hypothetical protein L218DRAFT_98135 [Marasmius fiardii PR-910]|nr:hypothetical protein L218DRAFT_98135 [Marasmius fiardii PR-910]